jgi:hypothetical protein
VFSLRWPYLEVTVDRRTSQEHFTYIKHSLLNTKMQKYCDMTPESWNSSLLGNGSVNTFPRKRTRNNRIAVFSVICAARVATQLCGKHTSAAVNQHATIEEEIFSVGAAPSLYNQDLAQNIPPPVEAGSNISTVALRVVGSNEKGTQCLGV